MATRPIYTMATQPPSTQDLNRAHPDQVMYKYGSNFVNNSNTSFGPNLESNLLSNILLDIRVATDVCRNLFLRIKELEQLLEKKNALLINNNPVNVAPVLHQQCAQTDDLTEEGRWIPASGRFRRQREPLSYLPPPSLPTSNSFAPLGDYAWNFPTLDQAAAGRFQSRNMQQQLTDKEACIPPLLNRNFTPRPPKKVFPPNQLKFTETESHVLDAPIGYAKVHSVDSTLAMSAGIAVDFKNEIGQVDELKAQISLLGKLPILKTKMEIMFCV
jgi:hypothetical protein